MRPSELLELRAYACVVMREREAAQHCGSKMSYGTRAQAERSIRRVAKRAGVEAYRCQFCGLWHVGAWRARK
jgi:hypothetical protein